MTADEVVKASPTALPRPPATRQVEEGRHEIPELLSPPPTRSPRFWPLGLACGLGGLIGGYFGARLQPHLPATFLRIFLGVVAVALALVYVAQAVR